MTKEKNDKILLDAGWCAGYWLAADLFPLEDINKLHGDAISQKYNSPK